MKDKQIIGQRSPLFNLPDPLRFLYDHVLGYKQAGIGRGVSVMNSQNANEPCGELYIDEKETALLLVRPAHLAGR
jgi:hypothetical protein